MIVIKTEEFEMVQTHSTGPFFNFSKLVVVNEGKPTERKEMKLLAYGLPFEVCIKRIVGSEMSKQSGDISASQYIERYRKVVEEVSKLITHVDKVTGFDHE